MLLVKVQNRGSVLLKRYVVFFSSAVSVSSFLSVAMAMEKIFKGRGYLYPENTT